MTSQSRTTTTSHGVSHSTSCTSNEASSTESWGGSSTVTKTIKGCNSWCNCSPSQQLLCWRMVEPETGRPPAVETESANIPLENFADYRFTERDLFFLSASDLRRLAAHLLSELAKRDRRVQGGDHA